MERQSWRFCRKLARAMYIVHHYGEWLTPTRLEMQALFSMGQQLEAFINILEEEAPRFQLSLTRTRLSTRDFYGNFLTWYTFQLSTPFPFEISELLVHIENFTGIQTLPRAFRLGFEIGFIGNHATYRTSGNKWKLHVSGATHLAQNNKHTICFGIEFLQKAHNHKIGDSLGHELLHAVLNVDDKGLGKTDLKFYLENTKLLEKEGLRLRLKALPFFKVFYRCVLDLIETRIVQKQIGLLDEINLKAYSKLNLPFSHNSLMKGNVKCPFCKEKMFGFNKKIEKTVVREFFTLLV